MGVRAVWLGLGVLAAAVAGAWLLHGDGGASEPSIDPAERADPTETLRPVLTPTPGASRKAEAPTPVGDPPTKSPARPRGTGLEGALAGLPTEVGRLEGTVRDADGKPVAGATVTVLRRPTLAELEERKKVNEWLDSGLAVHAGADVVTDAEGRFVLEGVPRGIQLFVRVTTLQSGFWAGTLERLEGALEVSLPRMFAIRGRVLDAATGFPAEGLRVVAVPQSPEGVPGEAKSGARGEFDLAGLRDGDYLVEARPMLRRSDSLGLDPELPPREHPAQNRVRVTAGAEGVELRVWRGYTIAGRVETQDGHAPAYRVGIEIYARSASGKADQRRRATATSAADGTFLVDALPEGAYELQFVPPADASGAGDAASSTWLHDVRAPAADLVVVLERGAAVRGRLEDEQAHPVTGTKGFVYVLESGTDWGGVHSLYATLNGQGGFSTPPLPADRPYTLLIRGFAGFAEAKVEDVYPGTDAVVRLKAARQLRGRVLAPDGAEAGAGVQVVAWAEGDLRGAGAVAYGYTDVHSQFVIDGLTSERYRVAAGGGGGPHGACEPLRGVAPGEQPIELTLVAGAPISGKLVDPRGKPVQAQTLQASGLSGNMADLATTRVDDLEGRFLIAGIRRGRVELFLYRDGKGVSLGQFDAPAQNLKVVVPDP